MSCFLDLSCSLKSCTAIFKSEEAITTSRFLQLTAERIFSQGTPSDSWADFLMDPTVSSKTRVPLVLSENPAWCSPSFSLPPSYAELLYSGWGKTKLSPLAVACTSGNTSFSLTYPHLPLWEKFWLRTSLLELPVLPRVRGDVGKVKLIFMLFDASILYFFTQVICRNFSAGFLDFHKGTLACGWLSKLVFFGD